MQIVFSKHLESLNWAEKRNSHLLLPNCVQAEMASRDVTREPETSLTSRQGP